MKEVSIKYYIEKPAMDQISNLIQENANITDIRIFPDIHYASEKSIPVGVAFKTNNSIYIH